MASGTIKSVFEGLTADIPIDHKFIDRIRAFETDFSTKNADHVAFFGGNLLGVHPVRFLPADRNRWFDDVLTIDDLALQDELYKLPTIDPNRKVASDVMNHSCIWAMYAIHTSRHLSASQKEAALVEVALVLQYKYLTSIMQHNFRYPADPAIAQAAYNALTRKFTLKVCGSWKALLLKRSQDILAHSSIHYRTYTTLSPDDAVIYMINDIQSRLREIVKAMVAVFYKVKEEGSKILFNKSTELQEDGITLVKDVGKPGSSYLRYAHEIVDDKATFIREEIVKIICSAMHTMPPKLFREVLEWLSVNHRTPVGNKIDKLIDETILYAYQFVSEQKALQGSHQGLTNMVVKLRALYMASRMVDPTLILTRDLSEVLVKSAVSTKNSTVIASLRTGVQLYIVLRTFAKPYYT